MFFKIKIRLLLRGHVCDFFKKACHGRRKKEAFSFMECSFRGVRLMALMESHGQKVCIIINRKIN